MDAKDTLDLDALNASLAGGDALKGNYDEGPTKPLRAKQLVLFNADTAGQDAMALSKVAKLIAAMSPEGRRASLCWLIGYFDPQTGDE